MEAEKRIMPWNDLAFRKAFTSAEHPEVTAGLITDFFGCEVRNLRFDNAYDIKALRKKLDDSGGDANILVETLRDVTARFETGDFVAEMQVVKLHFFDVRSLYYAFTRFCGNYGNATLALEAGAHFSEPNFKYAGLMPVYDLNILKAPHFRDAEPLRVFKLYDPVRKISLDKDYVNVAYFEAEKAPDGLTKNQRHWRDYFLGMPVAEEAPGYIKEAETMISYMNMDKEEKHMVDLAEKAHEDYKLGMYSAYQDGREEGIEQGREQGLEQGREEERLVQRELRKTDARKMKADGMEAALIAKYTGLSKEEIAEL
jgi:hypothetical protein